MNKYYFHIYAVLTQTSFYIVCNRIISENVTYFGISLIFSGPVYFIALVLFHWLLRYLCESLCDDIYENCPGHFVL